MAELSPMWTEQALRQTQSATFIPEQAELNAWRLEQLNLFLQQGLPTRFDENWKYTSISSIGKQSFTQNVPKFSFNKIDISAYIIEDTYRLVFINGSFIAELSSLDGLPDKVVLTSAQSKLSKAYKDHSLSPFIFLNGALMTDGFFLQVPANIELLQPIHILYLTTSDLHAPHMQHPRHSIQLQENSSAIVIEDYCQLSSGSYFNNVVTEMTIGDNAHLDFYKIQRESDDAFHIANTIVQQQQNSRVCAYHIGTGSQLSRDDLQFALQESGASCELIGLYYPKQHQLIDYHTRIDHFQSHTHSQQYYKGILADFGKGVFNGKIIAHPYAQQVTAKQANHNLLLSKTAEINTKPELEVYADNVKCTHGATVGNIDKNSLFYLQSRGISADVAQNLLLSGFANEILDRLPNRTIANFIREQIMDLSYE